MKINVTVDCTPEEARRFMGLPDLTPVHDAYVGRMLEVVNTGGLSNDTIDTMMKAWAPMGDAGMQMWKRLLDGAAADKS